MIVAMAAATGAAAEVLKKGLKSVLKCIRDNSESYGKGRPYML